jgi:hypothetical protein
MLIKINNARLPRWVKALPALAQSRLPFSFQAPLSMSANVKPVRNSEGMKLTTLK